jgi:hypothetical protein
MLVILIWKMRQDREFHTSRAQIQATVSSHKDGDKDAIQKAYDDLRNSFFPYNKNDKDAETVRMRETMLKEIARGPLRVTLKEDPAAARKIASKLVRGQQAMEQRAALLRAGAIQKMDPATRTRQGRRVS